MSDNTDPLMLPSGKKSWKKNMRNKKVEKKEKKKKNFMVGNEKDVVVNMTHRAEGQFQPLFFLYLI